MLTHIRARTQGFEGKLKEAGFEVSVSPIPMSAQVHQVLLMRAHAARVERAGARVLLQRENEHENDEQPFGRLSSQRGHMWIDKMSYNPDSYHSPQRPHTDGSK
jgi:hypothetical protein